MKVEDIKVSLNQEDIKILELALEALWDNDILGTDEPDDSEYALQIDNMRENIQKLYKILE